MAVCGLAFFAKAVRVSEDKYSCHIKLNVNLNSLTSRRLKWSLEQYKCGTPSNCIATERILTVARVQRWQNSNSFLQVFVFGEKYAKYWQPVRGRNHVDLICTFLMNKSRYDALALLADISSCYESWCGTRKANIRGTNRPHFSEASESNDCIILYSVTPACEICVYILFFPYWLAFKRGGQFRCKITCESLDWLTIITWLFLGMITLRWTHSCSEPKHRRL